jgi:hypothetical protein
MNRINQNSNENNSRSGIHDSGSRMRVQIFTQRSTKFSRFSYSLYGGSFSTRTPVLHYDAGWNRYTDFRNTETIKSSEDGVY